MRWLEKSSKEALITSELSHKIVELRSFDCEKSQFLNATPFSSLYNSDSYTVYDIPHMHLILKWPLNIRYRLCHIAMSHSSMSETSEITKNTKIYWIRGIERLELSG